MGGSPSQTAEDYQSINEAHDACVGAGIIPIVIAGTDHEQDDTEVRSHMMDLAQCPSPTTGTHARSCSDSMVRTTDAAVTCSPTPLTKWPTSRVTLSPAT